MHDRLQDSVDDGLFESWLVLGNETTIRVETNQPGVDRILKHALGDHLAVAPWRVSTPARGAWTIRALGSFDYREELAAGLPADGQGDGLADYWRGDFDVRRMNGRDGRPIVRHAAPFEGITRFKGEAKAITYLFPAGSPLFMPHLEHLVGHVLRHENWSRGFVDVHAAFVRYRGKGVALIGPRRAGKTSLAMHLLSRGAELLGSDMAQIRIDAAGGVEATSIPHMCRITRETVWDNAWLAETIGDAWDANDAYMAGPLFSHGKYELYDPSMDRVFGRSVGIREMTLDAILFPHFGADVVRQEIALAPPAEARGRLIASIRNDRPLADWLPFDLSDRERGEAELERAMMAGDGVLPAYDVHFGREATLDWAQIDGAFDRI